MRVPHLASQLLTPLHDSTCSILDLQVVDIGQLELTFAEVEADDHQGSASWRAKYIFGTTGRRVDNRIQATFTFKDGLILEHRDDFDFHRWASQALGPVGTLLGWSGWLRGKVQRQAGTQLDRFIARGNC